MKTHLFPGSTALTFASLLLFAGAAASYGAAGNATWNGTTDTNWSTASDWSGSLIPGFSNTATFNNAGNGNTTISLGSGVAVSNLYFNTASAAAYTIGSGAVGSQSLTNDINGGITLTSTVAQPQLINAAITLGTNKAAGTYNLTNNSTQLLTIAGGIAGNNVTGTAGAKILTVNGTGTNLISGVIANGGATSVAVTKNGAGTVTLSGSNTFTGALTLSASGGTVILTGNNTNRPANVNNLTVVNSGATLQLQAQAGNTFGGTSYALSSEETANGPLGLNNGGIVQLRSDSNVTFAGGNNMGGVGAATVTFDVNQLTSAGSNNTLSIAPLGFGTYQTTINVTGGNGYTLGIGSINNGNGSYLVLTPTTANLTIGNLPSTITGGLAKYGAGTLTLTGSNGFANSLDVYAGTVQLIANAANTSGGISAALNTNQTTGEISFESEPNSTLQLRSDNNVTFAGFNSAAGLSSGTVNFDVNQVTSGHNNHTITIAPSGFATFNETLNFTGGNGYQLAIGSILASGSAGTLTLNPTTANVSIGAIPSAVSGIVTMGGTGTLTLTAANGYTNSTAINSGTLALGPAGSITNSANIIIAAGAVYDVSAISGVALGSNILSGNGNVNGNFTDSTGSQVVPGGAGVVGTLTFNNNVNLAGGDVWSFNFNGTTNSLVVVGGNLTPNGTSTVNLSTAPPGGFAAGNYTLFQVTGTLGGTAANFALSGAPSPSRESFSVVYNTNTSPAQVLLQVTGSVSNLVWAPTTNQFWDIVMSTNWFNGVGPDVYYDGDLVSFTDLGAGTNPVLNAVVSPGSVTFSSASPYTLSGAGEISGGGSLTVSGAGTVTMSIPTNNYAGVTTLNNGVLNVTNLALNGSPSAIGAGVGLIFNGGDLQYGGPTISINRTVTLGAGGGTVEVTSSAATLTDSGAITGTSGGGLAKSGAGTLALTGTGNFNGVTTINAGTLQLSGSSLVGSGGAVTDNGLLLLSYTGAVAISNNISGSGGVTMNGSGAVTLSGDNSGLTGSLQVTSGTLIFAATNSVPENPPVFTANQLSFTGPCTISNTVSISITNTNTGVTLPGGAVTLGVAGGTTNFISAPIAGAGGITIAPNSGLVVLAGNNTNRPATNNNVTVVNNGDTLQLQANASNTVGGISYALSQEALGPLNIQPLNLGNSTVTTAGATLQLRSDSDVTFAGANNLGGDGAPGGVTVNFDVNQITPGNANHVLTLAPLGFASYQTTINVTGGNGYTLGIGTISNGFNAYLTLNPTTANLTIGGITNVSPLTKVGAGTLTLTAPSGYSGNTIVGAGTLALTASTAIPSTSPSIVVSNGAVLDVSATSFSVSPGQTLSGTGTVNGSLANSGTIVPGISGIGTLTLNNSPALSGGSILMEINRANTPNANLLNVASPLTFGGALVVTNIGATNQSGDTFTLFSAASFGGSFSSIALPGLPAGLVWDTSQLGVNGTITVDALPAVTVTPSSTNVQCTSNVTFTANATGTSPLVYQWFDNATNLMVGQTNATLTLNNVHGAASGNYTVVVTNLVGGATNRGALTVVDTLPPVITVLGANPITVECHSAFIDPGATALDACAGPVGVTTNNPVNTNAPGSYTITYTATDGVNSSTNTRTVNVVDTTAPAITFVFTNLNLSADSNCQAVMPDVTGTNYIIASDACSGSVTITQEPTNGTVLSLGTNTVVIAVADASNNTNYSTNTITVQDTTAPVITIIGANPATVECHSGYIDAGATALDNCSGVASVTTNNPVDPNTPNTYLVTYTATDGAGNSATNTRTVIVQDTTPPVITFVFTNLNLSADSNCEAVMPDVTGTNYIVASDACSGSVTITQEPTNGAVLSLGTNTVVIAVADASNNTNYSTNTITVQDLTAPDITVLGANPVTNYATVPFTDPGASAVDNCSGVVGVTTNNPVDVNTPNTYTVTYTATDGAGNSATNTRTVVILPLQQPVITSQQLVGGAFEVTFTGPSGEPYDVLTSPLVEDALTNWTSVANGTFAAGPVTYTNAAPTNTAQFYIIRAP